MSLFLIVALALPWVPSAPGLSAGPGVIYAAGSVPVTGNVTDSATLVGVAGATVRSSWGPSALTNSTGAFSLTIPSGTVTFQVAATGYFSISRTLTVTMATSGVQFVLRPHTYPVKGSVLSDAASLPIPGTVVTAALGSFHVHQVVGGTGQFLLFLENGTYTLTAQTPGYRTTTVPLTVNGAPVTQFFLLELNSTTGPADLGSLLNPPAKILGAGAVAGVATAGLGVFVVRRRERLRPRVAAPLAGLPSQRGPEDVATARAIARREAQRRRR